jgi:hypothetical protein
LLRSFSVLRLQIKGRAHRVNEAKDADSYVGERVVVLRAPAAHPGSKVP